MFCINMCFTKAALHMTENYVVLNCWTVNQLFFDFLQRPFIAGLKSELHGAGKLM